MAIEIESILPKAVREDIDAWLTRFPNDQRQSAVLYALRVTQEANNGSLTTALMDAVADYLQIPRVVAYECATFYSMYELEPVGKHVIDVCTNISCMLCGSDDIIKHLEDKLGIKAGETTKDGLFTLRGVECLAACRNAPMLQHNDRDYHENLTTEKVDELLTQWQKEGANG